IGGELTPALRLFEGRARGATELRNVGDDLQRVTMSADVVAEELRLHAGLIDEVLGRAAAQHHRGSTGTANDNVGRLHDVANDVNVAGAGRFLARLRQSHAD